MDKFDKRILECLQHDCTTAISTLAKSVGLGTTACWRRVNKLENDGTIQKRVALLDASRLNVGLELYVMIKSEVCDDKPALQQAIQAMPEIVDAYRMSGHISYLLRVVVPDMAAYDHVRKSLSDIAGFREISADVSIERIKKTTALPLRYVETVS